MGVVEMKVEPGAGKLTVTGHPAIITVTKVEEALLASDDILSDDKPKVTKNVLDILDAINDHIKRLNTLEGYPVPEKLKKYWPTIRLILLILAGIADDD